MDYTDLLGDKYARPKTAPSVPKEADSERPGNAEASESKPEHKPADTAGRRSSGKSGQGAGAKGKS